MIKAVIFDMYETLVTHYRCPLYFGAQMAADAGIPEEMFQALWRPTEKDRSVGKIRFEEVIEMILKENQCYSAEVIRKSRLFPYFDKVCLSYEEKIQKPDEEIYRRCLYGLSVKAEECIYIGDGGSQELETARKLGMKALQAMWYLNECGLRSSKHKDGFVQLKTPLEVLEYIV